MQLHSALQTSKVHWNIKYITFESTWSTGRACFYLPEKGNANVAFCLFLLSLVSVLVYLHWEIITATLFHSISCLDPSVLHSTSNHSPLLSLGKRKFNLICLKKPALQSCRQQTIPSPSSDLIPNFQGVEAEGKSCSRQEERVAANYEPCGGHGCSCTQYYTTPYCLSSRSKQQSTIMSLMTLMEMGHPKEHLSRAPLTSIGYSRNSPTEKLIMGRVFFFYSPSFSTCS